MNNIDFVKQNFNKPELINILNNQRLTVSERDSFLARIEAHPKDIFTGSDLVEMGICLREKGKLSPPDWKFIYNETFRLVWMLVGGVVIIYCSLLLSNDLWCLPAVMFGTSGVMFACYKTVDFINYVWCLKRGEP